MQPENQNDLFGDLSFDATAKQYIRSIASWAIVIVVVAVIGYLISLIQVFSAPDVYTPKREGFELGFKMTPDNKLSTVITILIGLLLNFFLYRFATQARTGLNGLNQASLNSSFNSLKTYFMIAAILCLLLFLFFVLGLTMLSTV